jgi:MFS family permease
VQDVLRYSALQAGVTFFVTGAMVVLAAGAAQALVTRVGVKPILAIGLALFLGAMIWYSQVPVHGSFAPDLLPGYLMVGVGIAFAYVPVTIAALAGVGPNEAGLASGLINTAQQMGGAVGVALASTVFVTHIGHGPVTPQLLTDGYAMAFWVLAGFAAAALIATLTLIRREELAAAPAIAPSTDELQREAA